MECSASNGGSKAINPNISRTNASSKWKTYGFIIAIIIGIIGLIGGAIGLAGYFHVGVLSHMGQFDAIIMMSVGGGGGALLLIIVGAIKNRKSLGHPKIPSTLPTAISTTSASLSSSSLAIPSSTSHYPSIQAVLPTIPIDVINIISDYVSKVVYGPEAWEKCGVEVLDTVPSAPKVDLSRNDKVLLYIPQRIRFNGKEQNLTLKALEEIAGDSFIFSYIECERQFGDIPASGGWVLIDKAIIPDSRGKKYETHKKMVEERGCSMPKILEVLTLKLIAFAFSGEQLYGPRTYTRCLEKVDGAYPVFVGDLGSSNALIVGNVLCIYEFYGVICVQREF